MNYAWPVYTDYKSMQVCELTQDPDDHILQVKYY